MAHSTPPTPAPLVAIDDALLSRMVRADQLTAVRQSVLAAIPINMVLSCVGALVAWHAGRAIEGLWWLALSLTVNVLRILVCKSDIASPSSPMASDGRHVERHLRIASVWAAASGGVWALIALLCDGYTTPQTIFYLTVVCGICAGSVIYGVPYAAVSISFITPALLSVAGCLVAAGGFDRQCLAAMALLFLAALLRGARLNERAFRQRSRLQNEATVVAAQLREAHERLQASAHELGIRATHDSLTGLLHRDGFTQAATAYIAQDPAHSYALMLLDLNGFKAVNDAFGHTVGDRVLQDTAKWLQHELQTLDAVIGRWGGDQFAVLSRQKPRHPPPEVVADALITAIPFATTRCGGHLGVSIGVSTATHAQVASMLIFADEALHEAKRAGRNTFRLVDDALYQRLAVRTDVERDLVQAIVSREIGVWFQPIISGDAQGRIHSLEGLLRWQHPRHGQIPPEQVIFAAASTGAAALLMQHILEDVCLALQTLAAHCPVLADTPIAMNISPREMAQLAVDDIVLGTLKANGVSPRRLHIEITEEVALDTRATRHRLKRLTAAGATIVLDDFGVGYSSLSSLRNDQVRQLKIDRSFICGLADSPGNQTLVEAVLQLGRSLNIAVVAEGIESQADLDVLQAMKCPLMQGYHIARPGPLPDIMAWAEQRAARG
ncbi:putative bifunctional diguanylate cyclase/phosphodiesterase [Variovorax ginsengisoli]|uniref:Diguanylate cyclase (GGDEF)-like protein n=1 Tax=Variovorax ginsengisoli TaxID=363844 RepID=A0ABT9SC05_9BURK|nr:GGDEF domain-containing phosphodiesterase [Variovorax ginsengisoli]MDP9901383.1 diguanylate cyclase (GGDEF)-like protein [Variovorax ginsengisoli]